MDLGIGCGRNGEIENEGCAESGSWALGGQRSFHFLRGVGARMQSEAVARGLRGKAVLENAGKVLGWNSHAVITHDQLHAAGLARCDPQGD